MAAEINYPKSKNFQKWYNYYRSYLIIRNFNASSQQMYASCVREFFCFIERSFTIDLVVHICGIHVTDYHEYIRTRKKLRGKGQLSLSMIRHHLQAIRLLFDCLIAFEEIIAAPVRIPKFTFVRYVERSVLTRQEVSLLYQQCITLLDRALISIVYGCGLRRSEAEQLNCQDIDLHQKIIVVRNGKYSKSRVLPLCNRIVTDLRIYLISERSKQGVKPPADRKAFFLTPYGRRMSGGALNDRLKVLVSNTKNVGLIQKRVTLHSLRHSIATHLIENGAGVEFVKGFLGHVYSDTAHIYTRKRSVTVPKF
jgi:integrase/recombinase XerD